MIPGQRLEIEGIFRSVSFDPDANTWCFLFGERVRLYVSSIWRLFSQKQLLWVSLDHDQTFCFEQPVDLVREMTVQLRGKALTAIRMREHTSDLVLSLSGNITLEVLIASTGCESYDLCVDDKRIVCAGAGRVAVVPFS